MSFDQTTRDEPSRRGHEHAAPAWLVVSGESGVRPLPLPAKTRIVVGRGKDCDVVVDEPSISRAHFALVLSPLSVVDLGSRNGTRVLGRRLTADEPTPVPPGAVIEAGSTQMLLTSSRPTNVTGASSTERRGLDEPILVDPAMRHLYGLLDLIAPTDLPVLVVGETGTGKEVFAQAIHARSKRSAAPMVCVNCAVLTGSLLESELFGHERGAFTGAHHARAGIFEAAQGGTLFLDEIGEMPLETQAKLLRAIETREVTRLGATKPRKVDIRFVSATNRDLHGQAARGAFRSDLLFRLDGFAVTIPPLRERKAEIVPLATRFLARAARTAGVKAPSLDAATTRALERHGWPGNVRELRLVMERALALSPRGIVHPDALMLQPSAQAPSAPVASEASAAIAPLRASMTEHERQRVVEALEQCNGNQTAAARELGISRRTLITKIELYGLARPRKRL